MKKLRVTVEGKNYDVVVEVLDEPAGSAPATSAPPARVNLPMSAPVAVAPVESVPHTNGTSAGPGDVPSPLAGKLVSIDVKVGDTVAEGAQVATIEAMKMNTYIFAPKGGRVAAVLRNPGDAVEEGAVLLKIG